MRILILMLFAFSCMANNSEDILNEMTKQQTQIGKQGVRGFILQQKVMPLIPLDSIKPSPPPPVTLTPPEILFANHNRESDHISTPASNEVFFDRLIQMNERIVRLEGNMERLVTLTKNIQESTLDNRSFILKLIEVLATALVGGSGLLAFLLKKKA